MMNNSREEKIVCSRCGEFLKSNQRNCLKCGQINFQNPDNEYMRKYVTKKTTSSTSKSNKIDRLSIFSNIRPNEVFATKAGNLFAFIITNGIIFILMLLIAFFSFYDNSLKNVLFNLDFSVGLIMYSVCYIELYSIELLLMKANKPWWFGLIIFGCYSLFAFIFNLLGLSILFLILSLGFIVIYYILAVRFDKNPLLMILFGPIMLPITAFSSTVSYNGILYVNKVKNGDGSLILYKTNKIILSLVSVLFLVGCLLTFITNKDKLVYQLNENKYKDYTSDVLLIVEAAKKSLDNDLYSCSNELDVSKQDVYYIPFDNAASYFDVDIKTSPFTGANYQGYIMVINSNEWMDATSYYIAVDDSTYGIEEVKFNEVENAKIIKNNFALLPDNAVICRKNIS